MVKLPQLNLTTPHDPMALATTPVVEPPNGTISNFVNPETRTELSVTVTSVIMAISLLFYFNRVYVKLYLMKRVTWDDATLLMAVVRIQNYTKVALALTRG